MKNKLKKYSIYILTPSFILIVGYFLVIYAANSAKNYVDGKLNEQKNSLINEIEYFEQGFGDRINIIQRKLDENSEAIEATSRSIPSPNFFQRLFNTELNKTRNEILSSIPDIIQQEIDDKDLDISSVSTIGLQIEGDTIRFPADQKYIEGYWGSLTLIDDNENVEPYFELTFVPIEIDIEEIRTFEDPVINQQRVFITAVDRRNNKEIEITSTDFNFIQERTRGFKFNPQITLGIHNVINSNEIVNMGLNFEFDYLEYHGNNFKYNFLSINANIYENERALQHFTTIGLIDITF